MLRRHYFQLASMLAGSAMALGAQQSPGLVNPMSTVRIRMASGTVSGRLAALDSTTLTLQTANGNLVQYARHDIRSMDRRGNNAKKGAKIMTFVGAGVGALFVGGLAVGLCETSSCNSNALPGAAAGTVIGAPVGAIVGALFGAMSGRWLPMSTDIRMNAPATFAASRSCGARFELQMGPQGEIGGLGQGGHFSIANACGSRGIVGAEWGAAARATLDSRTTFADATFGDIDRTSIRKLHSTFASAFYERPLGKGRFHPHLVGSGGLYSVTRELAEVSQPVSGDYYAVGQKYPARNDASTRKALGLGLGLKSWMPMGPNFAAGLGARMHLVGTDASRILEAGVNLAYRP